MSEFKERTARVKELGSKMRKNTATIVGAGALALVLAPTGAGAEQAGSGQPGLDGKGNYCNIFGVTSEPFRRSDGSRAVLLRGLVICQPVHEVGQVDPAAVQRGYRWEVDVTSGKKTRHVTRSRGPATMIVLPERGPVKLSGEYRVNYGSIVSDEETFAAEVPKVEDLSRSI